MINYSLTWELINGSGEVLFAEKDGKKLSIAVFVVGKRQVNKRLFEEDVISSLNLSFADLLVSGLPNMYYFDPQYNEEYYL